MTTTPDPLPDADEADLAEQRTPIEGPDDRPVVSSEDAAEADALEQGAVISDDLDEEAHPREDDRA